MAGIVKKTTMYLECKLTEPELKDASKKLAEAIQRTSAIEERMEAFKTQNKAEMAEAAASISLYSSLINTEKDFRNVPCELTYDFKAGMKTRVRLDTGEVVKVEPITDQERQLEIKLLPVEEVKP